MNSNPYDEHVSSVEEALPDNPTTGEWTVEGKAIWCDTQPIGIAAGIGEAERMVEAHNAALAAARMAQAHDDRKHWEAKVYGLEQQLAAERERAENAGKSWAETQLQLDAEREAFNELYDGIIDIMPQEFRQNNKGALHSVQKALAALAAERSKVAWLTSERAKAVVSLQHQLAAEQEKFNKQEQQWLGENLKLTDDVQQLREQLADEKQRNFDTEKKLRDDARARIEELKQARKPLVDALKDVVYDWEAHFKGQDTGYDGTALEDNYKKSKAALAKLAAAQADIVECNNYVKQAASAQKPLVDALKQSRERVVSLSMSDFKLEWLDEIDSALARVKEGK